MINVMMINEMMMIYKVTAYMVMMDETGCKVLINVMMMR